MPLAGSTNPVAVGVAEGTGRWRSPLAGSAVVLAGNAVVLAGSAVVLIGGAVLSIGSSSP